MTYEFVAAVVVVVAAAAAAAAVAGFALPVVAVVAPVAVRAAAADAEIPIRHHIPKRRNATAGCECLPCSAGMCVCNHDLTCW